MSSQLPHHVPPASFVSNVKLSGHLLGRALLRPPRDFARRVWARFLGTFRFLITS